MSKFSRFYWLAVEPTEVRDRALIVATRDGQTIDLQSTEADRVRILLNDSLIDFDQPSGSHLEAKCYMRVVSNDPLLR